jgi:molybdopterin/thiamine biosynthesis adenylyltransferase
MKEPVSLTIADPLFKELHQHLFPGDHDEHGAVITAGIAETERGTRLLAREIFLAQDGVDYVPGTRGYRALTAKFVAEKSGYCADQRLCYLAVHCHGGRDSVAFSGDDNASHERGYPALLDITNGGPVGALVLAENAVAGDIWTPQGRLELDHMRVIGPRVRKYYPHPRPNLVPMESMYDRHARLFGDIGQAILRDLKVGIIGLGGGGSLLSEWISRLGVGHIVAVDFDRIDLTNLPRVVGASRLDALSFLTARNHGWMRKLGKRFAKHKVYIGRRVAKQANAGVRYDAVVGNVLDEDVARLLTDVDFLLLASDSIQSRLVFNALIHQYLIPGAQVGAKVPVDKDTGEVKEAFVATRPVLPYVEGGCLQCHGMIPPSRLQDEALTDNERRMQRYVDFDGVPEPSVITLNVLSAAQAANDLMMMFTGLYAEDVAIRQTINFVQNRQLMTVEPRSADDCLNCSSGTKSRYARGDRSRLPCRMPSRK